MTDVPVAAIWTMAFVVALGRGWWSSFGAGLLDGLAILIRPNLCCSPPFSDSGS
jgi:hypothetical protein